MAGLQPSTDPGCRHPAGCAGGKRIETALTKVDCGGTSRRERGSIGGGTCPVAHLNGGHLE